MRKIVVAVLGAIIVGMMVVPRGVSAGTSTIEVKDARGDLGPRMDFLTQEVLVTWPDTTPVQKVGYFDILTFSLSYSSNVKTFKFSMEVSKALPSPGEPLTNGFKIAKWLMWIEEEPWNPILNPVSSLYTIQLGYDGNAYAATLVDYPTGTVLATLPFAIDGAKLQIDFTAKSIGNLASFWWMPCTVVQWSVPAGAGYWDLDSTDPGAAPGQVWWDIPWPSA